MAGMATAAGWKAATREAPAPARPGSLVVRFADGSATRLHGVPGIRFRAAERRTVVGERDVCPAVAVGVDPEVVEQLPAGRARRAFLADFALVHRHQPFRLAPAARPAG